MADVSPRTGHHHLGPPLSMGPGHGLSDTCTDLLSSVTLAWPSVDPLAGALPSHSGPSCHSAEHSLFSELKIIYFIIFCGVFIWGQRSI